MDLIGQDSVASSTASPNATTAASKNSPMSYANGVLAEGGVTIAYVTGVDLDVDNGLMQPAVVGANISPAVLTGRCTVKGTITALFKDLTLLNKFLNETVSQLQFSLTDPQGNTFTFYIPWLKYTGGTLAPPKDGAVILTLPFQALQQTASTQISAANGATALTFTAASQTFTITGQSPITAGFAVGDLITTANFGSAADNGTFAIKAIAGSGPWTIQVAPTSGIGNTFVDDVAAVGTKTISGPAFTLGITKF